MSKEIKIDCLPGAKKVLIVLILLVTSIVLLSLAGQIYRYYYFNGNSRFLTEFFNVDVEYNLPTWVNTLILLSTSIILFVIAYLNFKTVNKYSLKWLILAIIFFVLSTDEILKLHENLNTPIINYFNTSGYLHFAWILPGIIFLIILSFSYFKFLLNLPRKTMLLFVASGLIFISGCIFLEAIGGNYIYTYDSRDFTYAIFTTMEEFMEMIGLSLFIYSLIDYLNNEYRDIRLSFTLNKLEK